MWFPDSALKTAHAMEEFDLEGLPLFVLANWRGFSGGQRDLFEGVLQVGRQAADCHALRTAFNLVVCQSAECYAYWIACIPMYLYCHAMQNARGYCVVLMSE